eukprot:1502893-Pyramimonas_sp.AAC.1
MAFPIPMRVDLGFRFGVQVLLEAYQHVDFRRFDLARLGGRFPPVRFVSTSEPTYQFDSGLSWGCVAQWFLDMTRPFCCHWLWCRGA